MEEGDDIKSSNKYLQICFIILISSTFILPLAIPFTEGAISKTRATTNEWPEPYGDPSNTGMSTSSLPSNKIVSWSKQNIAVFSSQPIVADGTLVVLQDKVYAYDAETGTEKWTYGAQALRTPPAIGGGRLFGGNNPFVALDLANGNKLWTYDIFPMSPPTVYGDFVFVAELNKLYALNVLDGTLEWTFDGSQIPKVAAIDDIVYVISGLGYGLGLYALEATTGKKIWHYEIQYPSPYPPVIAGENIYFLYTGGFIAIRRSDGQHLFSHSISGTVDTPLSRDDTRFYFGTKDGVIHGVRFTDGVEDWTINTESLGAGGAWVGGSDGEAEFSHWFHTGITIANDGIAFITGDDKLWVIDYEKNVKWSYEGIYIFNSIDMDKDLLAVCNGVIYVAESDGGKIWAFGPKLPVANIKVKTQSLQTETSIKFDAGDSTSANGDISSYYFDFGDGANSGWQSEPTVSHTYDEPGTYNVNIQVKDAAGHRSPLSSTTIEVEENPTYLNTAVIIGIVIIVVIIIVILIMIKWRKERESRIAKKAAKRLALSLLVPTPWVKYQNTQILFILNFLNRAHFPISDVQVEADVPTDIFKLEKAEASISMISPGQTKQITFVILPTGECGDRELKARFRYYDFGQKKHEEFTTEPVKVGLVCPILNSREITPQQWEYTIGNLVHATETFTGVPMSSAALEAMLSQTLREFNLHPVPPQCVSDSVHEIGTRQRFFAIGVKGTPYAVQLEITGGQGGTMSNVTITAWSASPQTLVGFYHGLLDAIEKRVHIRDHLKGKVIIREVEGDYISGQQISVEDSVVIRSEIGDYK